jgi:hypothetical protein
MRARLSLTRITAGLQRYNYAAIALLGLLAAINAGLSRCTLAMRPEERPTEGELAYVQEIASLNGDWVTQREMLDNLSKTKRVIAKGYQMCKEFESKGYRGKVDRLEQVLLEKSQDVHDYGMAALNNLCPELKD